MNSTKIITSLDDIVSTQRGRFVLARGEHKQPVRDCANCEYLDVSYFDEPCISCSQARMVQGLSDLWTAQDRAEPPINEDVEEESMYYGGRPSKEYTEQVILQHLKEIRDIAEKYAGRQFMTVTFLSDGLVHIYNAAGYNDSGLPVIDATLKAPVNGAEGGCNGI
ncbi:MAG: hypothetical protein WC547_01155 [Candidatus Omnitrophota bacterium]